MRQHPPQSQLAINEYYDNNKLLDEDQSLSEEEAEGHNEEGERLMFDEDQVSEVDEQYILDNYNPPPPSQSSKSLNVSSGGSGSTINSATNDDDDDGLMMETTTTDEFGIPHVSINLQTASPSSYNKKKTSFASVEREAGSMNSTKNPYYSSPTKKSSPIVVKQQLSSDDKKRSSILRENNDEEGYRNPVGIPQPSNVPSKKSPPRVKFDSAQVVEVVPSSQQNNTITLEEFQKRYIERASSPPPFSVIAEEKLAKMDDVGRMVSSIIEKVIGEKTEEIKNFSEYLNHGVLQMMETQFNTIANVRNSPSSYSFEDSPQFKELLEKLEFLNSENEHLKLLLEEKDLEVESLREEAETMRQRYIMDIDKLTSEVAESRITRRYSPEPADYVKNRIDSRPEEEEEEEPRDYDDSPKRNSPPPSRTPPPTNISSASRTPEPQHTAQLRRSIDFNSAVRSALQNMSKEQTNPLSKSFDAKQFKTTATTPEIQDVQDGESSPEPMSVDRASSKKSNKTLDSITERMLRSLKGPVKAEDNAKQIDKMVGEIREQFKERGVVLPLKRVKDCVYSLGEGKAARKVHLNIINGALKVKIGGGYDDFMKFLSQSVRLLQVKKKSVI